MTQPPPPGSWNQPGYPGEVPQQQQQPQQQQPGGGWYPPGSWGYAQQPGYYGQQPKRPGTVLGGVIMTYVGSGLMLLLGALMLVGSLMPSFIEGAAGGMGAGASANLEFIATFVRVLGIIFVVLPLVVIPLAIFTQRGAGGARIGLTVVGGLVVLLQLASVMQGSPQTLVGAIYIVVALVLLWVGEANTWFRGNRSPQKTS